MSSVVQNTVSLSQESNDAPTSDNAKRKLDRNNNESTQPAKRSTRLRSKPQRYGQLESDLNDDTFFEEMKELSQTQSKADDEQVVKEHTPPCDSNTQKEQGDSVMKLLSPGQTVLYEMIMKIHTDVKVIQRTLVKMEVISSDSNGKKNGELSDIRNEELHGIDLPLIDENSITSFNSKLKLKDFYDKVVSYIFCFVFQ